MSSRNFTRSTPTSSTGYDESLPLDALDTILADGNHDFDVVTMVHCETPTGTLNDISRALDRLEAADQEILTVVDAVSSLGGVPVPTDRIDVCLGASQKCFSAPPGLATAAISDRAWAAMEARDPDSLYTNFLPWRDTDDGFPYTHLTTNVVALDEALSLLLDAGLDDLADDILRIGRMGHNARLDCVEEAMDALAAVLGN